MPGSIAATWIFLNETRYDTQSIRHLVARVVTWELKPSQRHGAVVRIRYRRRGASPLVNVAVVEEHREVRVTIPKYVGPDWHQWLTDFAPTLMQAVALGCARLVKSENVLRNATRFRTHPLTVRWYADAAKYVRHTRLKPEPPKARPPRETREATMLRWELLRRRLHDKRAVHVQAMKRYSKRIAHCTSRMKEIRYEMRHPQRKWAKHESSGPVLVEER